MKPLRFSLIVLTSLAFLFLLCAPGVSQDRSPAVAGQFYPPTKSELTEALKAAFAGAVGPKGGGEVLAVIAPHAGYVFSGGVAASAYGQIDRNRDFDNVFVIGPSHQVGFEGAAVYAVGDYVTPLGKARVNRALARELIEKSDTFSDRSDAHQREHSVEVQIPFLQYWLKKDFAIVPIVVGQNSPETCSKVATVLRPYMNSRNLFVFSTDFSHYPPYDVAAKVDRECADAVASNSPSNLLRVLQKYEEKPLPGLETNMCGWSGVLTLLYMTEGNSRISYDIIQYRNSGDAPVGGKDKVVGYYAIALRERPGKRAEFSLSAREKETLLGIARSTIQEYLISGKTVDVNRSELSVNLRTRCGAFVTLNKSHDLRGCIGRFDASDELYHVVQEMAIAAATQDYRFAPVKPEELKSLEIEISVLTPLRRIASAEEFELGKQGIYMRKGARSGTFLPQVAHDTGWNKEEFLGHCAQDKAGIGWDGWKDAELFVYEALVFSEKE
jgi:MEMO1 family protein